MFFKQTFLQYFRKKNYKNLRKVIRFESFYTIKIIIMIFRKKLEYFLLIELNFKISRFVYQCIDNNFV
jgi:hypothetical protein